MKDVFVKKYLAANAFTLCVLFVLFFEDSNIHFWSLIRWAFLENIITHKGVILAAVNIGVLIFSSGSVEGNARLEKSEFK